MSRARIFNISPAKMQKSHRLSLLVRLHARSITSIPGRRLALGQCHQVSHLRSFSSSSSQRYASPAEDTPAWLSFKEVARPAAMWLVPKGSKFDQQQVLDQLPKLDGPRETLTVALFFVTPKLAYLLEGNHSFLPRAINSIYGDLSKGALRQSIVAVVDALPILGNPKRPREPEIDGCEGIAICIAPGFDVAPANEGDATPPVISMTGKHPYFDGRHYVSVSCSAPVANTTFINGQQNTLFMQNWRNLEGEKWLPETKRHKLSQVEVPLYTLGTSNPSLPVKLYSKVMKLTDPKVITHSMGNIIRQVKTVDGQELAASHELEKLVPEMLKKLQKNLPTGDIRVFALVYPHELGGDDPFSDPIWIERHKRKEGEHLQFGHDNLRLLSLLARGARLYRVTSGGAGWGQKAGLLSLEPKTELGASTDAPKLPSFIFDTDDDIRMPGSADLFPPGHIVQFVATFHDAEGMEKDCVSMKRTKKSVKDLPPIGINWENPIKNQHFCIGNTILPETHQYTSSENIDETSTEGGLGNEATTPSLLFRSNQFGCLTSSALGFSVKYHSPSQQVQAKMKQGDISFDVSQFDPKYKHSSLVELPNSYFMAKFEAGEKTSVKAVRQYSGSEEFPIGKTAIIAPIVLNRELTQRESVAAASRRLRHIERIQKDSYLARYQKPIRHQPSGKLVRLTSRGSIFTCYGSEPDLVRKLNGGNPVRYHEFIFDDTRVINDITKKGVRARRRKFKQVRSFRVSLKPPHKDLMEPVAVKTEEVEAVSRHILSTPAWEKSWERTRQNADKSLRHFYRWLDSQPSDSGPASELPDLAQGMDEYEYDSANPCLVQNHTSHDSIAIRRVVSRKMPDLGNLGAESSIFRVWTDDGIHKDTVEDQAVRRMVEDL